MARTHTRTLIRTLTCTPTRTLVNVVSDSEGCYKYTDNHTFHYQPPNSQDTVNIDDCRADCTNYP